MNLIVHPVRRIRGRYRVPPDRELAQLAAILSLLSPGRCTIDNWPQDRGLEAVLQCLRQLGAQVDADGPVVRIERKTQTDLSSLETTLDCRDATAALWLFAGLLSGQRFPSTLRGEGIGIPHVCTPIIDALTEIGAIIRRDEDIQLRVSPAQLPGAKTATSSILPYVKTAILMGGLFAQGKTTITEDLPLPDDVERVLPAYGIEPEVARPPRPASRREDILQGLEQQIETQVFHKSVTIGTLPESLRPVDWVLPGDFSLAAPLVAAAAMLPKSGLLIEDVALNPTRTGLLKVLKRMGAEITTYRRRIENGVPVGDVSVIGGTLKATKVSLSEIPSLVSESPLLTILGGTAVGVTVIRGITELKDAGLLPVGLITENLRRMGAKVAELDDGWAIEGPTEWHAAEIDCGGNAAMGMAFAVAGLLAEKQTTIQHAECVTSRFPDFQRLLLSFSGK